MSINSSTANPFRFDASGHVKTMVQTSKDLFQLLINSTTQLPYIPSIRFSAQWLNKKLNYIIPENETLATKDLFSCFINLPQLLHSIFPKVQLFERGVFLVQKGKNSFNYIIGERVQAVVDNIFVYFEVFQYTRPDNKLAPIKRLALSHQIKDGADLKIKKSFIFFGSDTLTKTIYLSAKGCLVLSGAYLLRRMSQLQTLEALLSTIPILGSQLVFVRVASICAWFTAQLTATLAIEREWNEFQEGMEKAELIKEGKGGHIDQNHYQHLVKLHSTLFQGVKPSKLYDLWIDLKDIFSWMITLRTEFLLLHPIGAISRIVNNCLPRFLQVEEEEFTLSQHIENLSYFLNYFFSFLEQSKEFILFYTNLQNYFLKNKLIAHSQQIYTTLQQTIREKVRLIIGPFLLTNINTKKSNETEEREFEDLMTKSTQDATTQGIGNYLAINNIPLSLSRATFIYHIAPSIGVCSLSLLAIQISKIASKNIAGYGLVFGFVHYYFTSLVNQEVDYAYDGLDKRDQEHIYPHHDFIQVSSKNSLAPKVIMCSFLSLFRDYLLTFDR
jgi:hypothetical protein